MLLTTEKAAMRFLLEFAGLASLLARGGLYWPRFTEVIVGRVQTFSRLARTEPSRQKANEMAET